MDQTARAGPVAKLIQSLRQFILTEVLAANRLPLAHPYPRLEIRPAAEPASVG